MLRREVASGPRVTEAGGPYPDAEGVESQVAGGSEVSIYQGYDWHV